SRVGAISPFGTWLTSAGSATHVRSWGVADIRAQTRRLAPDAVDPIRTSVVAQFNRSGVNQFTPFDAPPLYRPTRTTGSAGRHTWNARQVVRIIRVRRPTCAELRVPFWPLFGCWSVPYRSDPGWQRQQRRRPRLRTPTMRIPARRHPATPRLRRARAR